MGEFIVGAVIGAMIGILIIGLLTASKISELEREIYHLREKLKK